MSTGTGNVARRASLVAIVGLAVIGATPDVAWSQHKYRTAEEHSLHRCGRLRSIVHQQRAEPIALPPNAYLATLSDTDLVHYALDLEVSGLDPVGNTCVLTGTNVMTIQSKVASLQEFVFRLRNQYSITGSYVNGATPVAVATPTETTRVVTLDRPYLLDETFTLTIEYTGNSVYIAGSDGSIGVQTQPDGTPVVATLSQPYFAYTWWPVKEGDVGERGDHTDKTTMEISITAPDTFTVPSNGLLQGIDVLSGNRKRHRWASSYPIIPSLVAFAATEYTTWTLNYNHAGGAMPVEFYIYPPWDTPTNRAGWEVSIDMIETFASLFGEYPFIDEKYGIYNFGWAGLEHQTITAQGNGWGYDPFEEYLTVHELAHQWWGDAVSCKTWNDIWISEGFASYADVLWDEYKPGGSLDDLKVVMAQRRMVLPSDPGSLYVADEDLAQLGEIFSTASYYKGAWVLHMLRHMFGDDTFFEVLRAFLTTFEYKAASTEDFRAVCESFHGESLDWFFQQWVYGTGYPSYAWGWQYVEISGQYYILLSIDQTQTASYPRFTMPIDILVDGTTNHVVLNDGDPEHFVLPVPSLPSSVEFDPGDWLLWGSVTEGGYVAGPPTIVATSPAPGATIAHTENINTVTITFHTSVNATAGDISLVGTNTGSKSFTLTSGTDVNPLILNLTTPLESDTYTLTITDAVWAVDSGMTLDGEMSNPADPASLPSGDGTEGGETVIEFAVEGGDIPTVSEWGLVILALLLSTSGTIAIRRKQRWDRSIGR